MHVSEAGCSLEFEDTLIGILFLLCFSCRETIGSVGLMRTLWQSIKVYWGINIDGLLNT